MDVSWFNPNQSATKHDTTSHSLTPGGMGEVLQGHKWRKLMGWDKDCLTGKAKVAHTSKAKQGIHSLFSIGRQVFSHLQGSRVPSHATFIWEKECHHSELPHFLVLPPALYCWAWRMVWIIPLVRRSQLSRLCPLPAACAPPASLLVGWGERQRRPWLCVSTAQQYWKHPCATSTVFSTDPKHSPILATVKEINSTPAKLAQDATYYFLPNLKSMWKLCSQILNLLLLPRSLSDHELWLIV